MKKKLKIGKIIIIGFLLIIVSIVSFLLGNLVNKTNSIEEQNYYGIVANANSKLIAENIKKGVTIGGITGTLEMLDTSDATATESTILDGETAYVNGVKIEGTYVPLDTSDATATQSTILDGKTAYVNGEKIEGTYVPLDTSDATATSKDIASGKIAYSKGQRITGTAKLATSTTRLTFSNHLYADGFTMGHGQSNGTITLTNLPYKSMKVVSSSYASATYSNGTLKITFDTTRIETPYQSGGWPQINKDAKITIDLVP